MALPAVTEVFKSSLDESVKKLVQPSSVVPATVFVLLVLAVLFPTALSAKIPIAVAFAGLDDTWKVVVVTAAVLVLGYVVLNLSSSIQRAATGESWSDSPVAAFARAQERKRIARVAGTAERALREDDDAAYRRWRAEVVRLPDPDDAFPTRLGNAMGGAAASVARRYGFDLAAGWTHLRTLLVAKEEKLAQALDDEIVAVQVLLNLAALILVFGAIAAALMIALGDPVGAAYQLMTLPVAYGLYRAGCARVASYLELVEAAVDLHRDLLREQLGLEKPKSSTAEREQWAAANRILLYDLDPPEVTDLTALTTLAVETSENVNVHVLPVRRTGPAAPPPSAASLRLAWTEHYALIASPKLAAECCDEIVRGHLVISGGKRWTWTADPQVSVGSSTVMAAVLRGDDSGDAVVVPISIPGGGSEVIRFDRSALAVALSASAPDGSPSTVVNVSLTTLPEVGDESLCFSVKNSADAPAETRFELEWTWLPGGEAPLVLLAGSAVASELVAGAWRFSDQVAAGVHTLEVLLPELASEDADEPDATPEGHS